jgi:hypothetical protein
MAFELASQRPYPGGRALLADEQLHLCQGLLVEGGGARCRRPGHIAGGGRDRRQEQIDLVDKLVAGERLAEMAVHSGILESPDLLRQHVCGHGDHRDMPGRRRPAGGYVAPPPAAHAAHLDVQQNQIVGPTAHRRERLAPSTTTSTSWPARVSIALVISRFISWSSATRIRPALGARAGAGCRSIAETSVGGSASSTQKVEPWPGAGETELPPHQLGQLLGDGKPEPRAAIVCDVLSSCAWEYRLNNGDAAPRQCRCRYRGPRTGSLAVVGDESAASRCRWP